MRDHLTPCADPANDPDDWFIEKDGRQYGDEPVLTVDEIRAEISERPLDDTATIIEEATEARLAENIRKRRHAKDKCHVECYFRTQCLGIALAPNNPAGHGTWGGYYAEELREIRRLRAERQRARDAASQDADVPGSE